MRIRTCSGRLTSMERDVFGYETGFFVLNHEFHPKFGMHSPNKGTETGIKEEIFLPRFLAIIIGKSASAISYLLGHGFIRASDQMKDWHEIEPASKYSIYFVARALTNTRLSDYQPMFDILFVTMFFVYAGIAGYILVDKL
jgi:hypothetical protein